MSIVKRPRAGAGLLVALSSCADPNYGGPAAQSDASTLAAPTNGSGDAGRANGPGKVGETGDASGSTGGARNAASDQGAALDAGGVPLSSARADAAIANTDADATATTLPAGPQAQADAGDMHVLPAWAAQLPGVYAVRGQEFAMSGGTLVRWLNLAKLEITQSGDQLVALLNACDVTAITQAGTNLGHTDGAEKLPPRRFKVLLEPDSFSVIPIDTAIGYDPNPPDSCVGHEGTSVMKQPSQTWIAGTQCLCGGESLPQVDDCRVTDPDGDGRPGYSSSSHALADVTIWGVTESNASYVQGHVGNDQAHTALFFEDDRVNQFGCDPVGACTNAGVSTSCSIQYNRALFAPLRESAAPSGGWTCAAIEEKIGQLFPGALSPFPTDCKP